MTDKNVVLYEDLSHRHDVASDGSTSTDLSEKPASEGDAERAAHTVTEIGDVAPDGGYGWVCVAACSLINGHSWGINSAYAVFLAYYLETNAYPSATPLAYAFVGGLSIAMSQIVAPIATILMRKYGTHATFFLGVVLQTTALLGASWTNEIWQLVLSQGICFGWGMGFVFNASVGIISQWFDKRRSFANSLAAAGSGIGGLIYSLAALAMIQSVGIGWAFRTLAIASGVVLSICGVLIRDRNKAVGAIQMAWDWSLLKRPEYILTLGWGFFSLIGYVVLLFSLPAYARSIGLTAQQGSIIGALLNLGQTIGRPFIGLSSDRVGRINIALLGTFFTAVFCFFIWIFATNYGVLIFFAIISGTILGTFWTTVAPVTAEVVGLQLLPSALSIFWPSLIIPSTFAEAIALELRKDSGQIYLNAQVFTGFMFIGATICLWFVRAWKIRELDKVAHEGEPTPALAEGELRNNEATPERLGLSRTVSVAASVKSTAKGLFALKRV